MRTLPFIDIIYMERHNCLKADMNSQKHLLASQLPQEYIYIGQKSYGRLLKGYTELHWIVNALLLNRNKENYKQ